jgi:hypothetical protein
MPQNRQRLEGKNKNKMMKKYKTWRRRGKYTSKDEMKWKYDLT